MRLQNELLIDCDPLVFQPTHFQIQIQKFPRMCSNSKRYSIICDNLVSEFQTISHESSR